MESAKRLAKKSLVLDEAELREWTRIGGFCNASAAVRDAVSRSLATRKLTNAISAIQKRGTFGSKLR